MTEGRYPKDDMFKSFFESSRPPRQPTRAERILDIVKKVPQLRPAKLPKPIAAQRSSRFTKRLPVEEAPGLSKPGVSSTSEVPRVTSAPFGPEAPKLPKPIAAQRSSRFTKRLPVEEAPGLSKPGVSSTSEVPRVTSAHAMADQRLHGRDHTGVVAGAIAFGLVAVITIGVSKITSTNTDVKSSTPSTTSKLLTNSASSVGVGSASSVGQDSAPTTLAQPKNINVSPTVAKGITNVTQASSVSSSTTTTVRALIGVPNSANAQITVRVANGTSIPGAAGRITSELQNLDFNVVVPVNATVSNLSTTTVYYYAGFSVAGEAIARILGLPSTAAKLLTGTTPLPSIYPSDVNVVLGTDVAG